MHWLLSQTLSFSEVDFYRMDGMLHDVREEYSPTDSAILHLHMVLVLGNSPRVPLIARYPRVGQALLRKNPAGMPIIGSCSAVIAATCYVLLGRAGANSGEDDDVAAGPL